MTDVEKLASEWANGWRLERICDFADGNLNLSTYAIKEVKIRLKKAFLAGAEAVRPKWIKCSDRLPEEPGWYLCAIRYFEKDGSTRSHVARDIIQYDISPCKTWDLPSIHYYEGPYSDGTYKVTHWMPIPEAPEDK